MNFEITEEQAMIRDTIKDFAQKEVAPVSRDNNRHERFPSDLIKKLGEMGVLGLSLPPEYGGGGADHISYCIMLEELGRVDLGVAVTVSSHLSLGGKTILQWGTEEQKQKYLPRIASGEILACLATTEPNVGSDVSSIETSAVLQGDEWVLNGTKTWISNGGVADVATIIVQTDKRLGSKGLTAFIIERGTKGFSSKDLHNKLGIRSSNTAELVLEDCRVPKANVLGPVGKGMSVALSAFDNARLGVAARTVGVAQACIDAVSLSAAFS
jgi:alkylation response protein AidB-like acyl-CoA dehydrogenase